MKFDFKIVYWIGLLILMMSSCSNFDPSEKIIGAWEVVDMKPEMKFKSQDFLYHFEKSTKDMIGLQFIFTEEGTYTVLDKYRDYHGDYIIDAQNVIHFDEIDSYDFIVSQITRVDDKEMIWFYDIGSDGGARLYFKRK